LLSEVGESLWTISAILGHSNLGTTMIYAHAIPRAQRRAIHNAGEISFPSAAKFSVVTENGEVN
jgi:site-specific recombinase XerD